MTLAWFLSLNAPIMKKMTASMAPHVAFIPRIMTTSPVAEP